MLAAVNESAYRDLKRAGDFAEAYVLPVVVGLSVYGLALVLALKLRRFASTLSGAQAPSASPKIASRPYSLALLFALLGMIGRLSESTTAITFIVVALWFTQAVRLLPSLIEARLRPFLYAMPPLALLECARVLLPFSPSLRRGVFLLNILIGLTIFVWLGRRTPVRRMRDDSRAWLLAAAARAGVVLLIASIAANIFGFLSLSQVLGLTALFGLPAAAILYGAARVLGIVLATLMRAAWVRALLGMRVGRAERWSERVLIVCAALLWTRGMLYLWGVYAEMMSAVSMALRYPLGYGSTHLTIAGVLSVLLVLGIGFALVKGLTFLLQRFLLPRLPLPRGVPHAVSTITYYLLLLLVALAALSNAGVELNRFTVLTGALGVGLGFGLQNIVNNFVSGVILLLERPIHVGDVVDVGGLVGTVKRIGARSSTVLTFQGAEVIVPNSTLISNQVINWTLSSSWRRVDIPVGVAHGTDPELVIKLLTNVAKSHPGVLLEREPTAFFLGFGESALNFELRFWSARQDTWYQLQSEVTVAIANALKEAGIEIPFPQRDLRLRSVDIPGEKLAAAAASPAGVAVPSSVALSGLSKGRRPERG